MFLYCKIRNGRYGFICGPTINILIRGFNKENSRNSAIMHDKNKFTPCLPNSLLTCSPTERWEYIVVKAHSCHRSRHSMFLVLNQISSTSTQKIWVNKASFFINTLGNTPCTYRRLIFTGIIINQVWTVRRMHLWFSFLKLKNT